MFYLFSAGTNCMKPKEDIPLSKTPYYRRYLLCPPSKVWETYCVCSVSYYYSSSSFFLSSAKSLSDTFLVDYWTEINEMLSTMSRCADYFRNFQNGCRCHGNGQNAKKIEKHKNDHSKVTRRTEIDETW